MIGPTLLLSAVLAVPATVPPASRSPAPRVVSLDEALGEAGRGAAVLVARAEADVRRRQVDAARVPSSPVLSLGTTRYSAREEVAVSQDVRWGGERSYTVKAAEELAGAADANAAATLREARRLVRQAWIGLAASEDAEALGKESAARADELLDVVRERVDGGRAPRMELVRTEAEAARIAAAAQALGESRRAAWSRLATLLGLDPASEGATDGSRPTPLDDAELAARVRAADPAANPAVVAEEKTVASAEATREASRRRRLPGLSFSVGVNADDPGLAGPDYQETVALTLPFGARGPSAVRLAEAEVRLQEARLAAARRDVAEALAVSERRVRAARARLEVLESKAVPAAVESAALTREAYAAGRGDVLRVIDAERALLEAKGGRLSAWAEEKAAEADLLAAAGEEAK